LQEEMDGANAIHLSLSLEGPGYPWIADWIEGKLSGNKLITD